MDKSTLIEIFPGYSISEFFRARQKGVMMSYTVQKTKLVDGLREERNYIQTAHKNDIKDLNRRIAHCKSDFAKSENDAKIELMMKKELYQTQVIQNTIF